MRKQLPPECAGCPFARSNWGFCPPDPITPETRLVVIGRDPGEHEVRLGRGFVGPAGWKLRHAEKLAGLHPGRVRFEYGKPVSVGPETDVAHGNVRLCRPPRNAWQGPGECWERLVRRWLEGWDGPILVLGKEALQVLGGPSTAGVVGDRYAFRGSWFLLPDGRRAWFSIHPSFIARGGAEAKAQTKYLPLLAQDIRRALENAPMPEVVPREPRSAREVIDAWEAAGRPSPVSIDVEEDSVIGVSWDGREVWEIPWTQENVRAVGEFWARGGIPLFHYATYDLDQLCRRYGYPLPPRWYDTIVMASVMHANLPLNLASLVLTYVPGTAAWKGLVDISGKGLPKDLSRVHEWRALWRRMLGDRAPRTEEGWESLYNALDVAWTWKLYHSMHEAMTHEEREYWTHFMLPLQRPLLEMGWRGIPADARAFERLRAEIDEKIAEASRVIDDVSRPIFEEEAKESHWRLQLLLEEREREWKAAGKRVRFSKARDLARARAAWKAAEKKLEEGFNAKSTTQRRALLQHYLGVAGVRVKGAKGLSTGEQAISEMIKRIEGGKLRPRGVSAETALRVLRALDEISKLRTLRANFLATEPDDDGRIRTLYHIHRTETGRLSSGFHVDDSDKAVKVSKSAMQLQNMPRFVRQAFVAEPGHVFVAGDWAAIEWSLAMLDAGTLLNTPPGFHLRLLERFQAMELDPHRYLASCWFNKPEKEVTKEERKRAKAITFGWLFGGTVRGLSLTTGMPLADTERACAAHDEAFKLAPWRRHVAERFGKAHRVVTMGGWQRWFWEPFIKDPTTGEVKSPKPTELVNSRIQGSAADLAKWALRRIFEALPDWMEMVTTTHDSFMLQVPEDRGEEAAEWLREKMEAPVPWLGGRRFRAEVKVGRSWGDV